MTGILIFLKNVQHPPCHLEADVVGGTVVGEVEIVGGGGPLSRHRVDLLHPGKNPQLQPLGSEWEIYVKEYD